MPIYVENTGQIRLTQELGQWISKYASDGRFSNYVEIGTWNGRGSTCCFYDGFKKRNSEFSLQSYEISFERFQEAHSLWNTVPEIKIIHGRIMQDCQCPSIETVRNIFPNMSSDWHDVDIANFWHTKHIALDSPQVVLLDGAEYLTRFEFDAMKQVESIQVFILDDTLVDKCRDIKAYLDKHPEWTCIAQGTDRNGWAVFERAGGKAE